MCFKQLYNPAFVLSKDMQRHFSVNLALIASSLGVVVHSRSSNLCRFASTQRVYVTAQKFQKQACSEREVRYVAPFPLTNRFFILWCRARVRCTWDLRPCLVGCRDGSRGRA